MRVHKRGGNHGGFRTTAKVHAHIDELMEMENTGRTNHKPALLAIYLLELLTGHSEIAINSCPSKHGDTCFMICSLGGPVKHLTPAEWEQTKCPPKEP